MGGGPLNSSEASKGGEKKATAREGRRGGMIRGFGSDNLLF